MASSPLSISGVERPYASGLVIGFTNAEKKEAPEAAKTLASAFADHR